MSHINPKNMNVIADISLAISVVVSVSIEITAGASFLSERSQALLQGHLLSSTVLACAVIFRSLLNQKKVETTLLNVCFIWISCPLTGPTLAITVAFLSRFQHKKISDMRDFLFDNAQKSDEKPLIDRISAKLKFLREMSRPARGAIATLDSNNVTDKIYLLTDLEQIDDAPTARIFKTALRDENFEIQMLAAKRLSEREEIFYDDVRNLLRQIQAMPDDLSLRLEFMRQCLIFYNANIYSKEVGRIWVEKAYIVAREVPSNFYNGPGLILYGRLATISGFLEDARWAFKRASANQSERLTAEIYLAELAYMDGDFAEVNRRITGVSHEPGLSDLLISDRVKYWLGI